MDYIDLIKLNQECQICKRFEHNGGKCKGRDDRKNCLIFTSTKRQKSTKV